MAPSLRALLFAALTALTSLRAAPWEIPPILGELSGELSKSILPGAPPLRWDISIIAIDSDSRRVTLAAQGEGVRFRAEAQIVGSTPNGTWTLVEATIDAKHWLPPALAYVHGKPTSFQAAGRIRITGQGQLRDGFPSGMLELHWEKGELRDPAGGWSLEAVQFDAPLAFDTASGSALHSTGPLTIRIGRIATTRFGAQSLEISGTLRDITSLAIARASIEIAGGTIVAQPSVVSLRPLNMLFDLQVQQIGLQDVAALVPEIVKAAYGKVDGEVRMGWSQADGLVLDKGHLVLSGDEPATVRLAPSPGLITNRLPATVLKYYPGLDKAELGLVPIRATALDVEFSATPDSKGRTAIIHLFGVPDDPAARGPVDLNVNVRGPLKPFIKLGTQTRFSFGER